MRGFRGFCALATLVVVCFSAGCAFIADGADKDAATVESDGEDGVEGADVATESDAADTATSSQGDSGQSGGKDAAMIKDAGGEATPDAMAPKDAAAEDGKADSGGSTDTGMEKDATMEKDTGNPAAQLPPNSSKGAIEWLQAKHYEAWKKESKVHKSAGPHDHVRTYFNAALTASLDKKMASHADGVAAVKEIFGSDMKTLKGWAYSVKTGGTWYFYESLSLDGQGTVYDNSSFCSNCHKSGKDHILSPWPAQ